MSASPADQSFARIAFEIENSGLTDVMKVFKRSGGS